MSDTEQKDPVRVSRSNDNVKVTVQKQFPNHRHNGCEYAASYQNLYEFDDGYVSEGISLSLFIKDEPTTRLLYECLGEFFGENND